MVQGQFVLTENTRPTKKLSPTLDFVRPLSPHARARLTQPVLGPLDRHGSPKMMLAADHMRSLPECFADIDDPRRRQGRRHPLPTVLAIATAATLRGARTYQAMVEWAQDVSQRVRERCRHRHRHRHYEVPSQSVIREGKRWNEFIASYHSATRPWSAAQMRYAVHDRDGSPLAMLGFSTAARKLAPRVKMTAARRIDGARDVTLENDAILSPAHRIRDGHGGERSLRVRMQRRAEQGP